MGDVARALGLGTEFEFEGKVYAMAPWTQSLQGQFERWLERGAWEGYLRAKEYLPPEEQKELRAQISQDVAARKYTFGSEIVHEAMFQLEGLVYQVYLLTHANHPEFTQEMAARAVEKDLETMMEVLRGNLLDPTKPARPPSAEPDKGTAAGA